MKTTRIAIWRERQDRQLQARSLMQAPEKDYRNALQLHVIHAIRRNGEIDR